MSNIIRKIISKYYYSLESIKNRYPCKIIAVKNIDKFDAPVDIKFIAATKINIRKLQVQEILSDPLLIEKFHPTDSVKLGFLACGEILLKDNMTIEEARKLYLKITNLMFEDILK